MVLSTWEEHVVTARLACGGVSILVLCHTLSSDEVGGVTKFHHDVRSPALILYLSVGGWNSALDYTSEHKALKGPVAFLAAVLNLSRMYSVLNEKPLIDG